MKAMYIILIFLLTAAAVAAWGMYFTGRQEPAAAIPVKKSIKEPVKKKADRAPAVKRDNGQNIEQLAASNIFEPNRGEGGAKDSGPAVAGVRVENMYSLTGIVDIDKDKGAIIINRNQPQGPQGLEPGGKGKAKSKHFYKTGDTLDGGYVLAAITQNGVTLKKGNDEQMLTISQKKNKAGRAGNIAAPGMPGQPPQPPLSLPPRQRGGRP